MPDTGAPWNIPYVEPSDLVRTYPAADELQALAIAAGLTAASTLKQIKNVITTADFTTSSGTDVDLTGVTVTVVPSDATNRIVMFFTASVSSSSASREARFRFRSDSTDLFEQVRFRQSEVDQRTAAVMVFDELAGSTASRDYLIRVSRGVDATTITVHSSSFIVMEYSV